jgi:hypothetical protein
MRFNWIHASLEALDGEMHDLVGARSRTAVRGAGYAVAKGYL